MKDLRSEMVHYMDREFKSFGFAIQLRVPARMRDDPGKEDSGRAATVSVTPSG
jgi:hypothetical protein